MANEFDFLNDFDDGAVELTAPQDLETIDSSRFRFSPFSAHDYMATRQSKTPRQKIETIELVRAEAAQKLEISALKNLEKQRVIEAKINEYKTQIDVTNADIVQGIGTLKDSQLETLNARILRVSKLLDTQKKALYEAKGDGILANWNYIDKTADIDAQIEEIKVNTTVDFDLSEGAKTGCLNWLGRRIYPPTMKEGQTIAMKKGDAVEKASIDYLHQHIYKDYLRLTKEEGKIENDFFRGQRDHVLANPCSPLENITIDTKNVSHQKLMLPIILATEIPDARYWTQGQAYCDLYDNNHFEIVYVLMNMPEDLIMELAKKELGWNFDMNLYADFRKQYIYDDVPYYSRIKRFKFERDDEYIEKMHQKVLECRRYIDYLIAQLIEHEKNNCL